MNLNDIENKLNELFSFEENRIIVWFDSEKEFVEDIHNLKIDANTILLDNSPVIETKYLIESNNEKYLLYTNKDNISLESNFFGDIFNYAYKFSADKISIILSDLEIPNEFKTIISDYSKFFNAKDRINDFKRLNIKHYSEDNISLGVICAALKETTLKFEIVLRKILTAGFEDNKYLSLLEKYDLDDDFWNLTKKYYYFEDRNPNLFKLFSSMLLTYTNIQFSKDFPTSLNSYVLGDENNIPVFLDNFMNNQNYKSSFDKLSDVVAEKLNLKEKFRNNQVDDYLHCDAFRLFDRNIVTYYVDLLDVTKQEININVNESRKTTHYYEDYRDYYMLINYANKFIGCINRFEEEILSDDTNILIKSFITQYSSIDKFYRKFYYHYDRLNQEFKEYEKLEELRTLIENMYSNTFLIKINNKFNELLRDLDSLKDISLTKQWNFYREVVKSEVKQHTTVVIISDAFRYGNALELNKIMEMDPTRKTKLQALLSTIPSYTKLGMASLLPHKTIEYKGNDVLVDGLPTINTNDRNKILQNYNPNSRAIKYDEIIKMNRKELDTFFKDVKLLYVYHDQIDARGDNKKTENEVFDAVEESLYEIDDLIKKLTNNNKCKHFLITSDHGFIYKRDKLQEYSKVNLEEYNKYDVIDKTKRFILTENETDIDDTICLSMDYMNLDNTYVTVPFGVNIFKVKGGGMNFVHGGAALEEVITPLLYVNSTTGKSKLQKQVELQLIDNRRKITSNVTRIRFFQKENINQNVTPFKASIYFIDDEGYKISDENIIIADVSSDNPEDREFIEKFTFQDKKYEKNKEYYLVINDADKDIEIDRYNYIIDIAFQDDFDFF